MDDQSTNDVTLDTIENKLSNDELDNLTLNAILQYAKTRNVQIFPPYMII